MHRARDHLEHLRQDLTRVETLVAESTRLLAEHESALMAADGQGPQQRAVRALIMTTRQLHRDRIKRRDGLRWELARAEAEFKAETAARAAKAGGV